MQLGAALIDLKNLSGSVIAPLAHARSVSQSSQGGARSVAHKAAAQRGL